MSVFFPFKRKNPPHHFPKAKYSNIPENVVIERNKGV